MLHSVPCVLSLAVKHLTAKYAKNTQSSQSESFLASFAYSLALLAVNSLRVPCETLASLAVKSLASFAVNIFSNFLP